MMLTALQIDHQLVIEHALSHGYPTECLMQQAEDRLESGHCCDDEKKFIRLAAALWEYAKEHYETEAV